jgi:hypothetical protein
MGKLKCKKKKKKKKKKKRKKIKIKRDPKKNGVAVSSCESTRHPKVTENKCLAVGHKIP